MKNSMAKTLHTLAYIIFFVGIIGSLILGAAMPTVDYSYTLYGGLRTDDAYNFALAIAGIVASIISGVLFLGFAEVIDLLQEIANGQKDMQVGSNSAGMPQTQEEMVSDIESDLPQL